jgi:Flp pilus assembly pilin Flp
VKFDNISPLAAARTAVTAGAAAAAAEAYSWLWTCGGVCFGYRRGDSLFTSEGAEVGRFVGAEIYGIDGGYIGEMLGAGDDNRLITNKYKKSRHNSAFVPTFARAYKPLENRPEQQLYMGHEDFPSAETLFQRFSNRNISKLAGDARGQDLIEYALLAGFVAFAAGALLPGVTESVSTIFSKTISVLIAAGG